MKEISKERRDVFDLSCIPPVHLRTQWMSFETLILR